MVTRSKLEHYGFQMFPRPLSLCSNKRQSTSECQQMKKFRLNDSHSDQLVNLFDKTLSTVTPDALRERPRRQLLPLCLSDNDTNMPILTPTPSDDQFHLNVKINANPQERTFSFTFPSFQKRCHDDEENSENIRSIKRSKCLDEGNKENHFFGNESSHVKRSRRGINVRSLPRFPPIRSLTFLLFPVDSQFHRAERRTNQSVRRTRFESRSGRRSFASVFVASLSQSETSRSGVY